VGRIPPRHLERIRKAAPDFLCLPEYFWMPAGARSHRDLVPLLAASRQAAADLSRQLDAVVVAGTYLVIEADALYNTAPAFDRGRLAGEQRKVRPMPGELAAGVRPGAGFEAIEAGGLRVGVLVCADVLDPASFRALGAQGVDLVFVPTLSPYRPSEPVDAKLARDRDIFQAGARLAGAPVFKACGVGRILGRRLQGRSLYVGRDGSILARVPPRCEGRAAVLTVDI
jgi:predicted amidohydrolase